jgi:hypothetical protein
VALARKKLLALISADMKLSLSYFYLDMQIMHRFFIQSLRHLDNSLKILQKNSRQKAAAIGMLIAAEVKCSIE